VDESEPLPFILATRLSAVDGPVARSARMAIDSSCRAAVSPQGASFTIGGKSIKRWYRGLMIGGNR
jgi:hypothetical protein